MLQILYVYLCILSSFCLEQDTVLFYFLMDMQFK
jgi:hypothetical protein